jgi:hypothetical protein
VARQAARVAAGGKPRGSRATSDLAAHRAAVRWARGVAGALAYLTGELRRLLGVVVPTPRGLLDSAARRAELDAGLALLAELAAQCPAPQQAQLALLHRQLLAALPALISFAAPLDLVHRQWGPRLGPGGLDLLAWAWQRRAILGPTTDDLLAALPEDWRPAAHRRSRSHRPGTAPARWHEAPLAAGHARQAWRGWACAGRPPLLGPGRAHPSHSS